MGWFFWSGLVWLGLDDLGWPHSYIWGLKENAGTVGMARASFHVVLLILKEAGPGVVHMVAKGSHQQEPLLVSHSLLSRSPKKVIEPSPYSTDREIDSAACWEEGQNHIAKQHACKETGTNWRLLLQQFISDNEENPD